FSPISDGTIVVSNFPKVAIFIKPAFHINYTTFYEKYHEIKLIFHRTLYNQPNRVYNFFWIRPA
ncbi:TPA: hypothetical protein ACWWDM_001651, partial [Enterococcus faecium]